MCEGKTTNNLCPWNGFQSLSNSEQTQDEQCFVQQAELSHRQSSTLRKIIINIK